MLDAISDQNVRIVRGCSRREFHKDGRHGRTGMETWPNDGRMTSNLNVSWRDCYNPLNDCHAIAPL